MNRSARQALGLAADFTRPGAEPHYAPDLGLEPVHLQIALRLDLEARSALGEVTHTVECRRAGERTLTLDAVDLEDLQVTDPDGGGLAWSYDGRRVELCWRDAPPVGERRRARVTYRVQRPLTGMLFSWPDEAYPDRPRLVATDHETERARYWLPCVDHPSVRTPLEIELRAAEGYTFLANGLETGRQPHDDGTVTVRWRLEQPCPSYLICLAVGDLVRAEGGRHGEVEVAFFAPPPVTPADLTRSFGPTRGMLDWLTAKLDCPFPYPKYYQLAAPGIGGAMENISLVTWDDAFVLDEVHQRDWGRLVDLINIHEMAHSYFGDAIVIRDFAHAWLKESWATYVETVWLEDERGADEGVYQLHLEAQQYRQEADDRYVRPIVTRTFNSSWDMFDAHLYPGGAWRLHMLRRKLGEDAFWAGVRDYVASSLGETVETADFRRKLEQHSGLSLQRFFDQWLESPGYPKLEVKYSWKADRGEAELTVEQQQVDRKQRVGTFAFPLVIAFELEEGRWERRVLEVEDARHALVVALPGEPLQVAVDPDQELLCALTFDPGAKLVERALAHGTLRSRLHAAETLAKSGKRRAIAAIEARWPEEPFWGVRSATATFLGESASQPALEALVRLVAIERDPMVLGNLVRSCGKYRDPAIATALRALLARDDLTHWVRALALTSLGSQRGEEHLDLLLEAADDPSWWGWVRRGAATGLGATRTERARQALLERAGYGKDALQVRRVTIEALAAAARWQDEGPRKQTLEALTDLTRDPDYWARRAAIGALGALGDSAGVAAVEAATRAVAAQDVPAVRRVADGLRKRAKAGAAAALEKRVEELEEKLRKLTAAVGLLEARAEAEGEAKGGAQASGGDASR